MFVRNKSKIDFVYRTSSECIVLKAGTVTLVNEAVVSAQDLINCYGQRIEVISQDNGVVGEVKAVKVVNKKDEKTIDDILAQVNTELAKEEANIEDEKINTGNEEVDAFLNGETDILPEGTEEISEEEAEKLSAEVEKAKEDVVTPKKVTYKAKATQIKTGRGRKAAKK